MSLASQGVRFTNATNAALVEVIAGTTDPTIIFEVSFVETVSAGGQHYLGWGRPAVKGQNPTTPALFQRDDPADPVCLTTSAGAWGVAPTSPVVFHRRFVANGLGGNGALWTWPAGFVVNANATAVLWNISATNNTQWDINFAVDEP